MQYLGDVKESNDTTDSKLLISRSKENKGETLNTQRVILEGRDGFERFEVRLGQRVHD